MQALSLSGHDPGVTPSLPAWPRRCNLAGRKPGLLSEPGASLVEAATPLSLLPVGPPDQKQRPGQDDVIVQSSLLGFRSRSLDIRVRGGRRLRAHPCTPVPSRGSAPVSGMLASVTARCGTTREEVGVPCPRRTGARRARQHDLRRKRGGRDEWPRCGSPSHRTCGHGALHRALRARRGSPAVRETASPPTEGSIPAAWPRGARARTRTRNGAASRRAAALRPRRTARRRRRPKPVRRPARMHPCRPRARARPRRRWRRRWRWRWRRSGSPESSADGSREQRSTVRTR